MNEPNNNVQTLQAIEGYLASHADRGDEAARALRAQLVQLLTPEDPSESLPAPVAIEHWNSPKYGGDADHLAGVTFSAELVDELKDYGRLMLMVSDDGSLGDEKMTIAFEVANVPGSKGASAALLLYDDDECTATLFRQPQGHLIVPMKPGVQILPSKLPDGTMRRFLKA